MVNNPEHWSNCEMPIPATIDGVGPPGGGLLKMPLSAKTNVSVMTQPEASKLSKDAITLLPLLWPTATWAAAFALGPVANAKTINDTTIRKFGRMVHLDLGYLGLLVPVLPSVIAD